MHRIAVVGQILAGWQVVPEALHIMGTVHTSAPTIEWVLDPMPDPIDRGRDGYGPRNPWQERHGRAPWERRRR